MNLQNRIVLVTASTRGIGLACARACAEHGAEVYLAARSRERTLELTEAWRKEGLRAHWVLFDAARPETCVSMVEETVARAGRLDVLVNNFGASDPARDLDLAHTDPQVFLDTVVLNLRSVFLASQAAADKMRASGGGSIVNVSSIGGQVPDVSQIGYGTAKAAINYLTRLIAVQEAHHGIRCNAVLPGMTATQAVEERLSGDFRSLFVRHIPLGRMAQPEEIASAVVYFAADESAYTTGQLLTVSGGFGLATPAWRDLSGLRRDAPR